MRKRRALFVYISAGSMFLFCFLFFRLMVGPKSYYSQKYKKMDEEFFDVEGGPPMHIAEGYKGSFKRRRSLNQFVRVEE